ncbi:MAG: protelomerase family protein [Phormidesmis sp.]
MPEVVKAARVEDFVEYCAGLRLSKTLERHVALFLAKLSGATSAAAVKHLCTEEKSWFEVQYQNDNTRAAHMTRYRKAIASMSAARSFPDAVTYEQETESGVVRQHLALRWMNYGSSFHAARQAPTVARTKAQRRARVAFDPYPVIECAIAALSSDDYRDVAAAIILLTGRRPTEILKSGSFDQVNRYQVEFSGQLKSRGKTETYPIYCLCRSHLLIDAFTRFRRTANIKALQEEENTAVDSRLNATINKAVRQIFGEVLRSPLGNEQLSATNLRAAYVNIAYHLFGAPEESIGSFAEDFLGHQNAGSAANYEDYYCVDAQGKALAIGVLRHELVVKPEQPKATKRTTIHVDGLLKERFEAFGSGTHKERVAQLLDAAERTATLERQLHSSNQRLGLARQHIELLQGKLAETEATAPSYQSKPKHTPIPDDWQQMSNAELNGSRIPGSADEKIRRSIEAAQELNAGLEREDQWSITPTILQKLSGSNANRVRDYLNRHPETAQMLEQYNSGFGYHQNRYRGDPREAMRWPLAYGEYEW